MRRLLKVMLILLLLGFPFVPQISNAQETKLLRVAFDRNLPPFSTIGADGDATGFQIDLIRLIAEERDFTVRFVPLDWEDAFGQLQDGKVDVILGAQYSSALDEKFDFSEPYFTMWEVMLVPKENRTIYDLMDLKEKVVAVERGGTAFELLGNIRRVKTIEAFGQPQALEFLVMGRADAFIGNPWTAEIVLQKKNLRDRYVTRASMLNPSEYVFAVREGNYQLIRELNAGLAQMYRDGSYSRLYNRYFSPFAGEAAAWWRQIVIGLVVLIALIIVVLMIIFFWNKKLQQEVRRRTLQLADSLAFQKQVLDHSDYGVISVDSQGNTTLINRMAANLLGVMENAIGQPILRLFPQLPMAEVLERNLMETFTGEIYLEDGSGRIVHYYIAPMTSGTGRQIGWFISLQDRTEQKHLQAKLIAQERLRALGQLVAGIAHELRNPLTAIKTFTELLPRKIDDPRFREEFMNYVPAEAERMNRIVEDLLDYVREKPVLRRPEGLAVLANSVLVMFKKQIENLQIEVEVKIPPDVKVFVDAGRIRQVLINLLFNAIEAMYKAEKKKLRLSAQEEADGVLLRVTDTGEGVDPEIVPRLFDPFFTTKQQGVGLGLYICRKIMQEHGGTIEVESQPGEGSTFLLKFPKEADCHGEHPHH